MDKEKFLNKNTVIVALSVALVFVSGIAISLGISGDEHGQRNENKHNDSYEMSKGDNNQNPNDGEVQGDQTESTSTETLSTTTVPVQKTK